MKLCRLSFIALIVLVGLKPAYAMADEVLVITNKASEIKDVSRRTLRQIYMDLLTTHEQTPINLPKRNHFRTIFNTKVIGLTESRISSYWAQQKFSGRGEPPMEVSTEKELLEYIEKNKNHIGYISDQTAVPSNVRVLMRIKY